MSNKKIYRIKDYGECDVSYIKEGGKEMGIKLGKNKGYHFRIHKKSQYIFFGDLDYYEESIDEFIDMLKGFMKDKYDLSLEEEEFKYTKNDEKKGSYHYSVPKWNASTEKLKEIHINILKKYPEMKQKIDTSIYSEHWFYNITFIYYENSI